MASVRPVGHRYAYTAPMSAEQRRWLSALYESNFAAVLKRCGAILKSGEDAADAAHEVFLIALNSLAPDTEEKRARAWLMTVAHNHCLDLLRRRRRLGRALLTLGANPDAGGDLEAGIVDRDFVQGVLGQLSLRERVALWQSAVEHRPLADIATGLQLSYAAAAQVVHRARQRAIRLAASVAAILAVLRFPRVARRVLDRTAGFRTETESLLAARRVIALAALPVIAGLALQSSTAGSTSRGLTPAVTTPAASSLLAPLTGANHRLGITDVAAITGVAGIVGVAGTAGTAGTGGLDAPAAISSDVTPALKSLQDRVQRSIGQLTSGTPATGSVATVPSPSFFNPPATTVSPVPSLPPIGH